jgi:hypothetical protein
VWFGAVPDKYNMLMQVYWTGSGHNVNFGPGATLNTCDRINQWVVWNTNMAGGANFLTASIGATTTAPDGTSTGYHVTEATNNGYHIMTAGVYDHSLFVPNRKRLAVFAKAGDISEPHRRTRCFLQVGEFLGIPTGSGPNNTDAGVRCVFDLVGGQIGVPIAQFGTGPFGGTNGWGAIGAGIIPYGNGWYLCYIDVSMSVDGFISNQTTLLQAVFGPDAGSGTGAANVQYVGDGTSGVYAWRTNMLPPRAWDIHTVSFFDDFNSASTIDVNNTLAPGFKWYCAGNTWPAQDNSSWQTPCNPALITVSGSVLTVNTNTSSSPQPNPQTAAYTGSGNYVGQGFLAPWLAEWNCSYGQNNIHFAELAFWGVGLEYQLGPPSSQPGLSQLGLTGEIDMVDASPSEGRYNPIWAFLDGGSVRPGFNDYNLFPALLYNSVWYNAVNYDINVGVIFSGHIFVSLSNGNIGNTPAIGGTAFWSDGGVYTGLTIDYTQNNLYATMKLPDRSKYDVGDTGFLGIWTNGYFQSNPTQASAAEVIYGSTAYFYNAGISRAAVGQYSDGYHQIFILGPGTDTGRFVAADYFRVTQ